MYSPNPWSTQYKINIECVVTIGARKMWTDSKVAGIIRQSGYFYLRDIIYLKEDEATGSFESNLRIEKKYYGLYIHQNLFCRKERPLFFLFQDCFNPNIMDISSNDFYWIQWIVTKSKSNIITKDTPYLTTNTFPDLKIFHYYFWVGMYSVNLVNAIL